MSRALGVTAQQGGDSRRLCRLVPFVDLINHAGDVKAPRLSRESQEALSGANLECVAFAEPICCSIC